MADSAILAAGGADAPLSYVVPGSAVITIKQIHVKYVDNGAGGDWLPAVRIVNDAGHTMGTAADQGVKVTAGSDADTSFFPGVKHAAAAAAGSALALATGDVAYTNPAQLQTVPAGASRRIGMNTATTSNAAVMSWDTVANPNDRLLLHAGGVYLAYSKLTFGGSATPNPGIIEVQTDPVIQGNRTAANTPQGNTGGLGALFKMDTCIIDVPIGFSDSVYLLGVNDDVNPLTVGFALLRVVYLGAA
jgi:hypothetical protein